jgi:CheY-like chemotaxis protein
MSCILVIGDDPELSRFLVTVLVQAGHDVRATNGRCGLEHAVTWPADIVITEMIMPHTDGIEIVVGLRRDAPDVRIIATCGESLTSTGLLADALLFGAHQVIEKPFSSRRLLDVVSEAVAGLPPPPEKTA